MTTPLPIALDAMGGDTMPEAAVDGALRAARDGHGVVLVGDEVRLRALLAERGGDLSVEHAPDVITMDEHATDVRRRKGASVMVAMRLVKEGRASAAVSMGHSGATMASALLVLGRLPGVERPAILANIPTAKGGYAALLDAGANADCRPSFLRQFALMGSIYARAVHGIDDPSVGLMSIGEEPEKGNELTRETHELLARTPGIRFHGNVEGGDLLLGTTDVVVTDGFTGNVVLKLAEGEARVIFGLVRDALRSSLRASLGGILAKPALRAVAARLDPAEVGAQPLLGVDGYAFIGHGSSDARAVASAIRTASKMVEARVAERIATELAKLQAPAPGASRVPAAAAADDVSDRPNVRARRDGV
ncbi:MAG: phosphate acyltransferase PlsX [Trueperaceae bacterium]|nr:phosphate acyltransferase PlsX [Trueperaceae bacterium]